MPSRRKPLPRRLVMSNAIGWTSIVGGSVNDYAGLPGTPAAVICALCIAGLLLAIGLRVSLMVSFVRASTGGA